MNAQLSYKIEQMPFLKTENAQLSRVDEKTTESDILSSNDESIIQKHKFYIGLTSSYDYCNFNYYLKNKQYLLIQKSYGYHLGLKLQYNFTENLSLRSGLNYSAYVFDFIYNTGNTQVSFNNQYGLHWSINSWNIPVMLGYTVYTKGKFKLTPSVGIIPGFILKDQMYITNQLNLGCEYFFNSNLFITIEPYINYWWYYSPKEVLFIDKSYKNSFGGIFSINYHF